MANKPTRNEWICKYCGQKTQKPIVLGRPSPGTCNKKPNKGPHSWVINRKL